MVRVSAVAREGLRFAATPDVMDVVEAEALARALARWMPTDEAERLLTQRAAEARSGQDFLDALGIFDARTWDPRLAWSQVTPAERLRVLLTDSGASVLVGDETVAAGLAAQAAPEAVLWLDDVDNRV